MKIRYSEFKKDPIIPTVSAKFDEKYVNQNAHPNVTKKVYICGPPSMNNTITNALREMNFDDRRIVII